MTVYGKTVSRHAKNIRKVVSKLLIVCKAYGLLPQAISLIS